MFVLPSAAHVKERITSKPEVVGSSFGSVPPNALVLIEPITFRCNLSCSETGIGEVGI